MSSYFTRRTPLQTPTKRRTCVKKQGLEKTITVTVTVKTDIFPVISHDIVDQNYPSVQPCHHCIR